MQSLAYESLKKPLLKFVQASQKLMANVYHRRCSYLVSWCAEMSKSQAKAK